MLTAEIKHISTLPGQKDFGFFEALPKLVGVDPSLESIQNEYLVSCHVMLRDNNPVGRFAIYKNENLEFNDKKCICIGAYHCIDNNEVSQELLRHADEVCKSMGYEYIIGPMNGSTWNQYRFAKGESGQAFFLDISNPNYYNDQFISANFETIGDYYSNLVQNLEFKIDGLDRIEEYYLSKGAKIRSIDIDNLEADLLKIAAFTNHAFVNNFLFTPIANQTFANQYLKLKKLMNPQFIFIVEDNDEIMHSIFFAIHDINDQNGKTLIIKTIAVRENSPFKGIATFQSRKLRQIATKLGYENVIHALMIEKNLSLNASNKYGKKLKEYSLYGKTI